MINAITISIFSNIVAEYLYIFLLKFNSFISILFINLLILYILVRLFKRI